MRLGDTADPCVPGKAHYWRIAPAAGKFSTGVCRYCKRKRLFTNYLDAPPSWHIEERERRASPNLILRGWA